MKEYFSFHQYKKANTQIQCRKIIKACEYFTFSPCISVLSQTPFFFQKTVKQNKKFIFVLHEALELLL